MSVKSPPLYRVHHCDFFAMEPVEKADLIVTDPPYFRVKNLAWDWQWARPSDYFEWLALVMQQYRRWLSQVGAIYVFASPQNARKVADTLEETGFRILNEITWFKSTGPGDLGNGRHRMISKDSLRTYFPNSERILFAERDDADEPAEEADLFANIRKYLVAELKLSGKTVQDVALAWMKKTRNKQTTGMASHWFGRSQWSFPTAANYNWLREILGPGRLTRSWEELAAEHETQRLAWEKLRRYHEVQPGAFYTDVWTYPPVLPYPGKHPCEKPLPMIRDMIATSCPPKGLVFDFFSGSGVVGQAAAEVGRRVVLADKSARWAQSSQQRTALAYGDSQIGRAGAVALDAKPAARYGNNSNQLPLFGDPLE